MKPLFYQLKGESEGCRVETFEGAGQVGQGQADEGNCRGAMFVGGHEGSLHVSGPTGTVASCSGPGPVCVHAILVRTD